MSRALAVLILLLPLAAPAQQMADPEPLTAPAFQDDTPPTDQTGETDPGREVNEDPTSLNGRGGQSLNANRTFQGTIGTSIYTPIGTPIGTRIGVPH